MTDDVVDRREAHGTDFSLASMDFARARSWEAVRLIANAVLPGMTEGEARDLAKVLLQNLGMDRIWHQCIVRFGEGTLKTFKQRPDPERVLGESDIFFVDIGPVWNGHEGDAGDTFVVGRDLEMHACAAAARTLWHDVAAKWRADDLAGTALYAYAAERAEAMGWRLNLDIKGHRVCDFPHAIYRAGDLGDFGKCPSTGLWILEIQIAHPTRPFGAFYEDLLIDTDFLEGQAL
ncbi:(Fe-S)-binding protein [Roseateles aquatilis]|uniref:(Fe-S)-binding protein n=1 Tax=Roseateles aquatilis TaxID=431061 RepID=A0A246J865_9BURK|nr:M24 family metallopeptidase [Roseateles aquatilis]MBY0368239.1 M24 family metallopeptidase [Burkholderiaceae bacterium]OWQ88824.1 (Fe-S)-binding protein [Roseateles aquatilis]